MHPLDELKAYVRFDADDERRLASLRPHVTDAAVGISNRFYERILEFPDAANVFEDMAQVERLKKSLVRWIDELLTGPYDHAYYELRRRIGYVHVKVRLPPQYMFTAMNQLMGELHGIALAAFPDEAAEYAVSLRRITDIELAIMLGTYIDVREQGKLEVLRDLIVSHLRTTVILVDKRACVVTSTISSHELFRTAAIIGQPLRDVVVPALLVDVDLVARIEAAVADGRELVLPRVEIAFDDRARTLRVAIIPLHHPSADALIQIEDLTETIAAESRAKQAEHLAKLGMMAASVAHEIRNPLAGISGTVQFIASSLPSGDPRVDALDEVKSQIARLGTLVGDLLNFSRPITAQGRPIELALVAQNAVAQASASEGYTATVEGAGSASADAALLAQVILNLVQNAWQAGAKNVVVAVSDGRVLVSDDGPGVAPEHRAHIFEPFFTTKVKGTGLGLPVAKKIVEAMDGTLSLTTSSLGGAAFDVRLPA